jgi:ATP-dependent protease HslVU (ClpYQ) peptidase subunit
MSVMAFREYYAIGSGASYALGALHALYATERDPATLARRGCEAAIAFDVYCGGEIDVRRIQLADSRRNR